MWRLVRIMQQLHRAIMSPAKAEPLIGLYPQDTVGREGAFPCVALGRAAVYVYGLQLAQLRASGARPRNRTTTELD